ncbi:MAG: hypothetical protein O3C48_08275 [Crenarchaeota archaeon]|nr:hypothetical protein [Thermoproteota archaeon]
MITPIEVEKFNDEGKPILELTENKTNYWKGEKLEILPHEEKIVDQLKDKFEIEINKISHGIRISAKDFAGVIEFENFILKVNSKFVSLKNFGRFIDFSSRMPEEPIIDEIRFQGEIQHPIEPVIRRFLWTTQKLIHYGLYKSYTEHQEDVSFLRGKLIMKQQILNDHKFNMKFNCEFDEFISDNLENQIILYTLKKCKLITKHPQTKKLIQELIHQIDSEIKDRQITVQDFRKITYTRLNDRYRNPHHLAEQIIKNIGMQNLDYQRTKFITPFFIYMPDVWEDFLVNLLKINYDKDIIIKSPNEFDAWYKNGTFSKIRPDIIFYKEDKISSIIDAKYMRELKVGGKELYQIAFYLKQLNRSTGYAILPYEEINNYDIEVPKQRITIKVRHIPVDEYLDILWSKKLPAEFNEDISSKLKKLIPLEN